MNLATPGAVRHLMETHGFRLKKRFGQNFLVDRNILLKIVAAAGIAPESTVLEIGPGIGALTQVLAEAGARVVAVEIDSDLVQVLNETMRPYAGVTVIAGDALRLDLAALLPPGADCRVVANLPYYITSPLLMKLFTENIPLTLAVVMVQREVAGRIVARPGGKDYGALTVALAYRADAEVVALAPRQVFFPPPDVDSAVIRLIPRPCPYPAADAATFGRTVRLAFGQRRKTLRHVLRAEGYDAGSVLAAAGLEGERRGETLNLEEFGRLSLALVEKGESGAG